MPLFTRENAAILGRKGGIARWSRPPEPEEPAALSTLKPDEGARETASQTLEEIRSVSQMLRRELQQPRPDAERLDLLSRTKERLWKVYAHAGGVPIPAPVKAKSRRDGGGAIDLVPTIDLLPEPAAVLNSENDVLNPENAGARVSHP